MPTTKRNDPAESLHLALVSFDTQIAELRETRAQLATLIDQPSASSAVKVAAPRKRRLSAEARAKISATTKASWARERTAKAKTQKPKKAAKKTQSEAKRSKTPAATAKAKKSPTKKETKKSGEDSRRGSVAKIH
jgi:pyruvate/2-oxoglutarate dehydrogenase complex dihydrolipoamide acyltransferase (E2) component